jgi:hypothetical protein
MADRSSIALRHGQIGKLLDGEIAEPPMLAADAQGSGVQPPDAISEDLHLSSRHHFVEPGLQGIFDRNIGTQLLGDLADDAGLRVLSRLEPAAWQFPFTPLVLQENDP